MKPVNYRHSYNLDTTESQEMAGLFGTLLVEYDKSESYETETSHLFKKGTKYIWIDANGCSCWDGDYEGWELGKAELKKLAQKTLENKLEGRDSASELVAKWVVDNI